VAKPRSRSKSKRQPKRASAAKALRSTPRAEDILQQKTAYKRQKTPRQPKESTPSASHVSSEARRAHHPMEVAAQHWMQALALPWAGWTALGIMMFNLPLAQWQSMTSGSRDAKPRPAGKAQARA
jgi:hypothetical protein